MGVKCASCESPLGKNDSSDTTLSVMIDGLKYFVCCSHCQENLKDDPPSALTGFEMHFPQVHGKKPQIFTA